MAAITLDETRRSSLRRLQLVVRGEDVGRGLSVSVETRPQKALLRDTCSLLLDTATDGDRIQSNNISISKDDRHDVTSNRERNAAPAEAPAETAVAEGGSTDDRPLRRRLKVLSRSQKGQNGSDGTATVKTEKAPSVKKDTPTPDSLNGAEPHSIRALAPRLVQEPHAKPGAYFSPATFSF